MPRKYTIRSKEEKLAIVKEVLAGMPVRSWEDRGIDHQQVRTWTRKYLEEGEAGLEQKKKPGNPLSRYERRKELTYEEQLQYQIELLKRELVKKEAEVLRLKKLHERKGGDARRK
jgi:transposase-like protein